MFRALLALALALPGSAQVKITQGQDRIAVEIDGKPFTTFLYGNKDGAQKPYLDPLRAASGTIVTRHVPADPATGEAVDHPHQRGLFIGHFLVNGYDFWSNESTYKTKNRGSIVLKKVDKITDGKKSGAIRVTLDWVDPNGTALLSEDRTMTFYAGGPNRVVDFDVTFTPLTTVTFADEKDAFFALRLAAGLEEKDKKSLPNPPRTGHMVNAEGLESEANAWGKRSNWMDYYGELNGEKLGVAILDHPDNPRHPTYWHTRAYGLFSANPFGAKAFEKDSAKDGSLVVEPGHTLRFRYRVIIHPGDVNSAGIAAEWAKYSGKKS